MLTAALKKLGHTSSSQSYKSRLVGLSAGVRVQRVNELLIIEMNLIRAYPHNRS
jgi:hypothetical protein